MTSLFDFRRVKLQIFSNYLTQLISIYFLQAQKKILIAPLNWGLGHASRDIPIIRELLRRNVEVIVAADGRPLELLRKEFPELKWIRLNGYDMKYQRKGSFTLQIILQIPKLLRSYFAERKKIEKIIVEEKIDAIISDNRFGLFSKKIPCVFITHQVGIIMPSGLKWFERRLYRMNISLIKKYRECWIPDFEGEENLSGELAHKYPKPENVFCIGPLTRFSLSKVNQEFDVLIVLSGPEPQRTILENILSSQVKKLSLKTLLVRGVAEGSNEVMKESENFFKTDFMIASQLNHAFLASGIIISRSGYSTVMDLAAIGKKAIFIPTPGQTEQEHLAENFKQQKIFYCESQNQFDLERAIAESKKYSGLKIISDKNKMLEQRIDSLLQLLQSKN